MIDKNWFEEKLYPFQDHILSVIGLLASPFYLGGGTAVSRGYLNHRYSEDLDLFMNDNSEFNLWAERLVQLMGQQSDTTLTVNLKEPRFIRLSVIRDETPLKIELINDVPAHFGKIREHPVLGRIDSPENLLANKITAAIDRSEPKDFADIWGLCKVFDYDFNEALKNASSKAAGIFQLDLARVLVSVTEEDWKLVRWKKEPDSKQYLDDLKMFGESLI